MSLKAASCTYSSSLPGCLPILMVRCSFIRATGCCECRCECTACTEPLLAALLSYIACCRFFRLSQSSKASSPRRRRWRSLAKAAACLAASAACKLPVSSEPFCGFCCLANLFGFPLLLVLEPERIFLLGPSLKGDGLGDDWDRHVDKGYTHSIEVKPSRYASQRKQGMLGSARLSNRLRGGDQDFGDNLRGLTGLPRWR